MDFEHRPEMIFLLLGIHEQRELVGVAEGPQHGHVNAPDRPRHAGVNLRVLAQDRGQQGRARPRQAGNKMNAVFHDLSFPDAPLKATSGTGVNQWKGINSWVLRESSASSSLRLFSFFAGAGDKFATG